MASSLVPTGSYAYVETSDLLGGTITELYSKEISYAGPACTFDFWYHMYGQDVGDLYVMLRYKSTGKDTAGQCAIWALQFCVRE